MSEAQRFRARCRLLRLASLSVLCGLALLYAFGAIGGPWLMTGPSTTAASHGQLMAIAGLPALGYLWALWAAQRALADLAEGRLFHATLARAIRQIGAGVLIGALLNVFAVTNLARWIRGGEGSYLNFDVSGIVLGVVGAALILLSRVVDQARRVQAELDEIL